VLNSNEIFTPEEMDATGRHEGKPIFKFQDDVLVPAHMWRDKLPVNTNGKITYHEVWLIK